MRRPHACWRGLREARGAYETPRPRVGCRLCRADRRRPGGPDPSGSGLRLRQGSHRGSGTGIVGAAQCGWQRCGDRTFADRGTGLGADTGGQGRVCRDLALLGGDAAVPSLGALLAAPETAEMARYALERIPGERSVAALRQALGRTSGAVKIGIVNSLGRRRDGASVDVLKALLVSSDAPLAGAAAEALGRIGNRAASQALLEVPVTLANAHALLQIAGQPGTDRSAIYRRLASDGPGDAVRAAALEGLARTDPAQALPLLRTALTSGAARLEAVAARELARLEGVALAKGMTDLSDRAQVRIVAALADSGGVDVRPCCSKRRPAPAKQCAQWQ